MRITKRIYLVGSGQNGFNLTDDYDCHVYLLDCGGEYALIDAGGGRSTAAILTNIEAEDEQAAARDDEHLRLSTIHQAKGLEFDVVFVIMLCDGLFPSARSMETPEGEEEERRLFYVAITRAKSELYLSFPMTRATYSHGDAIQHPSRFLKEIPPELLDPWNLRSAHWGTGEESAPF